MIRLRYEVEAYDVNGDDVRVCVHVDSVLDAQLVSDAGAAAVREGLRSVGAIIKPGPPAVRVRRGEHPETEQ